MLVDRVRLLGDDHPRTLLTLHYLALARADCGDMAEALALLRGAVPAFERVCGAEHPHSVAAAADLERFEAARPVGDASV